MEIAKGVNSPEETKEILRDEDLSRLMGSLLKENEYGSDSDDERDKDYDEFCREIVKTNKAEAEVEEKDDKDDKDEDRDDEDRKDEKDPEDEEGSNQEKEGEEDQRDTNRDDGDNDCGDHGEGKTDDNNGNNGLGLGHNLALSISASELRMWYETCIGEDFTDSCSLESALSHATCKTENISLLPKMTKLQGLYNEDILAICKV